MTLKALLLPSGGALPDDVWRARHRGILRLLWLHVPGVLIFAVVAGNTWVHALAEVSLIAGLAVFAQATAERRRDSTLATSLGLMVSSAVIVHLSGGVIEAHFHFFVMVGVVVLYQDWRPFLLAISFVVLHHGVIGVLSPHDVYNHGAAQEDPWTWAAIHGLFILGMSVAGIANWKLNERSQAELSALAAIVESSNDAIYGWAPDGTINSWNKRAVELFGYSPEEVVGRPFTVLVPPEGRDGVEAMMQSVLRGARVEPFDAEWVQKDGGLVEVSLTVSPVRDPHGAVVGGATVARDIRERKRNERALQETLSLLGATLESTSNGILVVDPEGRISSLNSRFAEMWRLPEDILRSRDDKAALAFVLDQLIDPEAFLAKVDELYREPEAESEDMLQFRDGREFQRSSKPLRVGGAVVGRVWSFHDLTDRKRLEAELGEARDKALESSRLKSEFLATMSHEIRTPMNGVIGLTGLLLETDLDEQQQVYADGVRASGEALLGIINDILDFSKIEAGKLELETVDFDLAQALDEVAGLVAGQARAKNLELVAYCMPDVPTMVRGDVGRLRQILLNLTSNAVKFTPAGEVVLRACLREPAGDDGVVVRFEVTDTGIGIDPATAARLFQPFSQADASTTRRYGGTGLGLAICRRLAGAMGGTIGLQSEPGQGSTFWVDIPLGRAPLPDVEPADHPLRGVRVLVVDDSQTNRLVLAAQLMTWDIQADLASDGFVALERMHDAAAAGRPYHLVLVDMVMPGMDGLELGRAVTGHPALASIRLLMLTSVAVDGDAVAGAGFSARLTKPARRSQLYDALLRAMAPDDERSRPDAPAPPATAAPSKGRLLIVEDNAINQAVAKGLAAKLGYACDLAGNGYEALEALGRRHYDAVLMDCQMPEMDGFEATAEIRRREAGGPRVPIVAMTAGALVEDRDRCLAAGMDDYLAKPVKGRDLDAVLTRWLGSAEPPARKAAARPRP